MYTTTKAYDNLRISHIERCFHCKRITNMPIRYALLAVPTHCQTLQISYASQM